MKRDMDIIRQLLLEAEARNAPLNTGDPITAYHVSLLKDADYVEAIIREGSNGMPTGAIIHRITWQGHDFLDAARSDTLWHKAKDKFLKPGVSWTVSLLGEWLKAEAKKQFFPEQASG